MFLAKTSGLHQYISHLLHTITFVYDLRRKQRAKKKKNEANAMPIYFPLFTLETSAFNRQWIRNTHMTVFGIQFIISHAKEKRKIRRLWQCYGKFIGSQKMKGLVNVWMPRQSPRIDNFESLFFSHVLLNMALRWIFDISKYFRPIRKNNFFFLQQSRME